MGPGACARCTGPSRSPGGIENRDWKPWTLWDGTGVLVPGGFAPEVEEDGALVLRSGGEMTARMPCRGFYFDRYEKHPGAAHPDLAIPLYERFVDALRARYSGPIETGEFGAVMEVAIVNDGPVTLVLER